MVRNKFSDRVSVKPDFSKDNKNAASAVQQSFAKDANINVIMDRYSKSGILVDPRVVSTRRPIFGDFSKIGDFQTIQNKIVDAHNQFMRCSAKVRKRFNNSAVEMLDFIADPKNKPEAVDLGLLEWTKEEKAAMDAKVQADNAAAEAAKVAK